MKMNSLQDIYNCLSFEHFEVNVDKTVSAKALMSIDKMLKLSV